MLPSLAGRALLGVVMLLLQGGPQIPAPQGLVNDFAHVIPAASAQRIESIAQDVRDKSKGEIAVVTLPDLGGRDPSDVAREIGRQWKVGKIGNPGDPTRNAGAVILLVPKETSSDGKGHCWIATGNGAEGFITDAEAGDMCREATPFFRNKDYGQGIVLLTYLTAEKFAAEFHFTVDTTFAPPQPESAPVSQPSGGGGFPPQLIFLGIVFVLMFLGSMRRGRRGGCGGCIPIFLPFGGGGFGGGGWGGGGFGGGGGGGFGGFGGGGGFSGGGGGSSW
jgi:uncharacterized protein